jgi:hypothetical protein
MLTGMLTTSHSSPPMGSGNETWRTIVCVLLAGNGLLFGNPPCLDCRPLLYTSRLPGIYPTLWKKSNLVS